MMIDYKNYHRDREYRENEDLFKNIFEKRYLIIKRYFAKPGEVLEVGSSRGLMLDIFRKAGWKTWGVDPSESSYEARKKGHRIIKDYFEKAKLPENYFDLVILNHVLEHMDNPKLVLKKIYALLKESGILFIDVPNFGSLSSRLLGKKWPYLLPKEHKSQFTKESLTELLKSSGFKVIYWESRSGIFEYANPLKELGRKRFLIDILTSPYCLVASALHMGDSMSFVAEKK